jgi:hypothetical protein
MNEYPKDVRSIFGVCALATIFAGCAGTPLSSDTVGPANGLSARAGHTALRRDSNPNLLYVAVGDQIDIFPLRRNAPQSGTITTGIDGPLGLCIDGNNALYVANVNNSTVTVYPLGSTTPSATYSQDLDEPQFPVVDANGDLFVSNANGTVVEYPPGSTYASQVLYMPDNPENYSAHGVAVDQQGTPFVAYQTDVNNYNDAIAEFAPGSNQGTYIGPFFHRVAGIFIDDNENLIGESPGENGKTNMLEVIPLGSGTPVTVTLAAKARPVQVAMQSSEQKIYVSVEYGAVLAGPYPLTGVRPPKYESFGGSGIAVTNI